MLFSNTAMTPRNSAPSDRTFERELQKHKSKYFFQGILLIIAGIVAAIFPAATAINVGMIIGAILLITGVFRFFMAIKAKMHWCSLFSAVLSMSIGIILLILPLPMMMAFVALLAIFLTIEGTLELLLSFEFRPARNWSWMLFSGFITLLLALAMWIGWPLLGIFFIGLAISINLFFYGFSLLMLVYASSQPQNPVEKS